MDVFLDLARVRVKNELLGNVRGGLRADDFLPRVGRNPRHNWRWLWAIPNQA